MYPHAIIRSPRSTADEANSMLPLAWLTLLIVGCTIGGIAVGRWRLLRTNRTTLTLLGAALLLGSGAMSLSQAYAALDLDTLLLITAGLSNMISNVPAVLLLQHLVGAFTDRQRGWLMLARPRHSPVI